MRDLLGGYTEEELSEAFNKVSNNENWKLRVNATLKVTDPEEVKKICFAVGFFTGSVCDAVTKDGETTFTADGYYMAVGA